MEFKITQLEPFGLKIEKLDLHYFIELFSKEKLEIKNLDQFEIGETEINLLKRQLSLKGFVLVRIISDSKKINLNEKIQTKINFNENEKSLNENDENNNVNNNLNNNNCNNIEFKGEYLYISEKKIPSILRDLVFYFQLLLFKNPDTITPKKHLEITKWFGKIVSVDLGKHPKIPHPQIFRVSNDMREGFTGVGTSGWHIDGCFEKSPWLHSLYTIQSISTAGPTLFLSSKTLLNHLEFFTENLGSQKDQEKYGKIWKKRFVNVLIRDKPIHPFIFGHPRNEKVPCVLLHLKMSAEFAEEKDKNINENELNNNNFENFLHKEETQQIITDEHVLENLGEKKTEYLLNHLRNCFSEILNEKDFKKNVFEHFWEKGDLIVTDNLTLFHFAPPSTQKSPEEIGLRVLHRTAVEGDFIPRQYKY